jgi:hypothetical protein
MTSVCRELGAEHDMAAFMDVVAKRFCEVYDRDVTDVPRERLGLAAPVA